jgi:Putative TM nitroreductase
MTATSTHAPARRRSLFDRAVAVKKRVQFTGWLQYLPTGVIALLLLAAAGVTAVIIGWHPLAVGIPLALGGALAAIDVFDIVTLKFGIRPAEPRPPRRDDLDAFDLMRSRRSCRSFQKRMLCDADRAELLASVAARTGPDAQIGTAPVRLEYVRAQLTVWPVVGATEFLVAIAPAAYDRMAVIDVGRCLQHVVLDATRAGIATCWIGPGAHHGSIIDNLGDRYDADRDHIICVCAVGYRSRLLPLLIRVMQRYQHRRKPLAELFSEGSAFATPLATDREPFAAFGRTYEACQWSPSSFNGQPTRAAAVTEGDAEQSRLVRIDFASATASRYYAPVAAGIWCANWETGCQALDIGGRLARLDRPADADAPSLVYDVSWILDVPMALPR